MINATQFTLRVVDWCRDEQPLAKVKSAIEASLDADMPISYDKVTFATKTQMLLSYFIDMAVQGYGWVEALRIKKARCANQLLESVIFIPWKL